MKNKFGISFIVLLLILLNGFLLADEVIYENAKIFYQLGSSHSTGAYSYSDEVYSNGEKIFYYYIDITTHGGTFNNTFRNLYYKITTSEETKERRFTLPSASRLRQRITSGETVSQNIYSSDLVDIDIYFENVGVARDGLYEGITLQVKIIKKY